MTGSVITLNYRKQLDLEYLQDPAYYLCPLALSPLLLVAPRLPFLHPLDY